jgi:1-acyl-sn-glycerol-3-phosphate acyltransferase
LRNESLDPSRLEADVFEELVMLLREAKGPRSLAALHPDAFLEKDLGLGSLEKVELLSRLERRLHRRAPEKTLGDAETARDLARAFLGAEELPAAYERERLPAPAGAARIATAREAPTLCDALAETASAEPLLPHIYLREDDRPEGTITYDDLLREALLAAGALRERKVAKGDPVAIMLPTSREFFSTFMGALFAGAVPVPLYPPLGRSRIREYARRQAGILRNAGAKLFVTVPEGKAIASVLKASAPRLTEVVSISELVRDSSPLAPGTVPIEPDDPALIQYTSGSTGEPKGVLLSHRNLLANIGAIGDALRIGPADVGASWLPLYHDMGLIGAWLTPLCFGIPVAILSPVAFLTRPQRWLWTIHRRRATISPAPNFAYELAARKIAESDVEGLDLSSWRAALNGAEPVSPRTVERFARKFGPHGFRAESMLPVYGLAECSLLLAAPELGAPLRVEQVDRERFETSGEAMRAGAAFKRRGEPLRFVSVGKAIPGHEIRIADERGEELPERREGRLLFRGPSVMKGYYRSEAATLAVLRSDGFVDSGDRAFVADGQIFITGRAKDLIIKAGRNLIPQEIEAAASEVGGVRKGSIAAFGVPDAASGTERIVVVVEARDESSERKAWIAGEVERRIADLLGIVPDEVVVVPERTLTKTSSGKLRRSACRESYLRGELGRRPRAPVAVMAGLAAFTIRDAIARGLRASKRTSYGVYLALLTSLFVFPAWVLALLGIPRSMLLRLAHRGSRLYLALAGIPFEVRGREALERRAGPFIFVSNHASYLDPVPLMAALELDSVFAVKNEAFSWPLLGRLLRKLEHVPVERARADESASATQAMKAALARGRSLVLFPEGTFSRASGVRPFKLGAFKLAAETGIPVVPLALAGTRRLLRDGTWIPRRVPVSLEVGAPIPVEGSFASIVRAKEEAAEEIARRAGEPRLDLVAAEIAD